MNEPCSRVSAEKLDPVMNISPEYYPSEASVLPSVGVGTPKPGDSAIPIVEKIAESSDVELVAGTKLTVNSTIDLQRVSIP